MAHQRPTSHYNIEKTVDDAYRISVGIAALSAGDISVEVEENALIVATRKNDASEGETPLHRGIANRAFEKRFQLADHVCVETEGRIDGMLDVDLIRLAREALKPRRIEIISAETKALPEKAVN